MTKRYFAFVAGLRGAEGQIFDEMPFTGEGAKKVTYLFGPVVIDASETLDDCILKFKDKLDAPLSD